MSKTDSDVTCVMRSKPKPSPCWKRINPTVFRRFYSSLRAIGITA